MNPTPPGPLSELEAVALMARCPRFRTCAVPSCPLDLFQDRRVVLPGEPRCTLPKERRRALGAGTALPFGGLTLREWQGEQRWAAMPASVKARFEAGRKAGLAVLSRDFQSTASPETDSTSAPPTAGNTSKEDPS